MSFMEWALHQPPLLPVLFAVFILIGVSPTIYYLLKMIYSPCNKLQGGGSYEDRRIGNKDK